jgi:dephospho-CoA kinase
VGKRVVGLVGPIGAGKDTVARLIESLLGFRFLNISDFVRASAKAAGIGSGRSALTAFSADMLAKNGATHFVDEAIKAILALDSSYFVVSGVRTHANVSAFTDAFGHGFCLVAVDIAETEQRHRRIRERGDLVGALGSIDLRLHDCEQERIYRLSETIALARLRVDNSGSPDDLASWVLRNAEILRTPGIAQSNDYVS